MSGKDIFKIWANEQSHWARWVRPVPFIDLNEDCVGGIVKLDVLQVFYADSLDKNTAVFVDLYGYNSVLDGLALAAIGWRPVPLYNGTDAQSGVLALVDNKDIKEALFLGAKKLSKIDISLDAPPAFLLDTERMHRFKMNVTVFDNSWDLYAQDVPTADYFLKHNIDKIVLRSAKIQKDLKSILYAYQKKGIKIFLSSDGFSVKPVKIRKQK